MSCCCGFFFWGGGGEGRWGREELKSGSIEGGEIIAYSNSLLYYV